MQDQNYLKAVSGLCPSLREPLAAVPGSARKCACFYPVEGEQTA